MLGKIKKLLRRREDEEGQGLVEYGLILGLIAVVAIAALNATGTNVNSMLQRVANTLDTVS
ncbi:MAG: Flp family type IVb pilin [Candidatus Wallbacteria bacterium]|nr:Flp family type IVb pilin [Candidatus Wallbacteria bacterium]